MMGRPAPRARQLMLLVLLAFLSYVSSNGRDLQAKPVAKPVAPTPKPITQAPTVKPVAPTPKPITQAPTVKPVAPTPKPITQAPTVKPVAPTPKPQAPTLKPIVPAAAPTSSSKPSFAPTVRYTPVPSMPPSAIPTKQPTRYPSAFPTKQPTFYPSALPTTRPTASPTSVMIPQQFLMGNTLVLTRGNLLGKISLPQAYNIGFRLSVTSSSKTSFTNVILLTSINSFGNGPGQMIPSLSLAPTTNAVNMAYSSNGPTPFTGGTFWSVPTDGTWVSVIISIPGGGLQMSATFTGTEETAKTLLPNTIPPYGNVWVYASSPWADPAVGTVRDLVITATAISRPPSARPSLSPTLKPSSKPTLVPSKAPTLKPSANPSLKPTLQPTAAPTVASFSCPQYTNTGSCQFNACPGVSVTMQDCNTARTSYGASSSMGLQLIQLFNGAATAGGTQLAASTSANSCGGGASLTYSNFPSCGVYTLELGCMAGYGTCTGTIVVKGATQALVPSARPTTRPTARPSAKATVQPSREPTTLRPSARPTANPTPATPKPSARPSLAPTPVVYNCPSYSQSGSCYIRACGGQSFSASGCAANGITCAATSTGNQLLRLATQSGIVLSTASNNCGLCAALQYTVPGNDNQCFIYEILQGCVGNSACGGTIKVTGATYANAPTRAPTALSTTARPTAKPSFAPTSKATTRPSPNPSKLPSFVPTLRPSSRPTLSPSAKPSLQPTKTPTARPTLFPTAAPTVASFSCPQFVNQGSCSFNACPGVTVTMQDCNPIFSSYGSLPSRGQQFIRLFNGAAISGGSQLAASTQANSCGGGARLSFSNFPRCGVYTIEESCVAGSGSCVGTIVVVGATHALVPSARPTMLPTARPSARATVQPSPVPTTLRPSARPTAYPTLRPSMRPSLSPTLKPSSKPTLVPSKAPTLKPSANPSLKPTLQPTAAPTVASFSCPQYTNTGSCQFNACPGVSVTMQDCNTARTSYGASSSMGLQLIQLFNGAATAGGTQLAASTSANSCGGGASLTYSTFPRCGVYTIEESCLGGAVCAGTIVVKGATQALVPSARPTTRPTARPSARATVQPSPVPTTLRPSARPTANPTLRPSMRPSLAPTQRPSPVPSRAPSAKPSARPSPRPSPLPTLRPTVVWFNCAMYSSRGSCSFNACPGAIVSMSDCNAAGTSFLSPWSRGQQVLNLYFGSTLLATSSLANSCGGGAMLLFSRFSQCGVYRIEESCAGTAACTGTIVVTGATHAQAPSPRPTLLPSPKPSPRPSPRPTPQPSRQPTAKLTPSPTRLPTRAPTRGPTPLPTRVPTKAPSAHPTRVPTRKPSPAPTLAVSFCPAYRGVSTGSATTSYTSCFITLCPGIPTTMGNCDPSGTKCGLQATGDQFLRLFDDHSQTQVASNGNACGLCASISYTYNPPRGVTTCKSFELRQGCSNALACSGRVTVVGATLGMVPTRVPTPIPTTRPSVRPTPAPSTRKPSSLPSRLPSLKPSPVPSRNPTLKPSSRPTFRPPTPVPSARPSNRPTAWPSPRPTIATFTCPQYTNTGSCQFNACPGTSVTMQDCNAAKTSFGASSSKGQQLIHLFSGAKVSGGAQLAASSPRSNCGDGASLTYSAFPRCGVYTIEMGCASALTCVGTIVVIGATHALVPSPRPTTRPTIVPSPRPTTRPSPRPTFAAPTPCPSRSPTLRPSSRPTFGPTLRPSAKPSLVPTRKPSPVPSARPSPRPTTWPSPRPTVASFTCPQYTKTGSCQFNACPGVSVTMQDCNAAKTNFGAALSKGKQLIQLFNGAKVSGGTQLTASTSANSCGGGASLTYSAFPRCGVYTLELGCLAGSGSCTGTIVVTGATQALVPTWRPTALPTPRPSFSPSARPSPRPSPSPPSPRPTFTPTLRPSSRPTFTPTLTPTRAPTTGQPTRVPSVRPSPAPTRFPSPVPSVATFSCPVYSGTGTCEFNACPGVTVTMQDCNNAGTSYGSPYSRGRQSLSLVGSSGQQLAASTDAGSCGGGARLVFSRFPACGVYTIRMGCVGTGTCTGVIVVIGAMQALVPTPRPTLLPSPAPSARRTPAPSPEPTFPWPTAEPTFTPTLRPSSLPTLVPTFRTQIPTLEPSAEPTHRPSLRPSPRPSAEPTHTPTTAAPTALPTNIGLDFSLFLELVVARNSLYATLQLPAYYNVAFDIFPTAVAPVVRVGTDPNILRMAVRGPPSGDGVAGGNIPGVNFLQNSLLMRMQYYASGTNDVSEQISDGPLALQAWTSVYIQLGINVIRVFLSGASNSQRVLPVTVPVREWPAVNLWLSDPWRDPASCRIRSLRISVNPIPIPTLNPTRVPSPAPSTRPTLLPSAVPSPSPSRSPSSVPTPVPTAIALPQEFFAAGASGGNFLRQGRVLALVSLPSAYTVAVEVLSNGQAFATFGSILLVSATGQPQGPDSMLPALQRAPNGAGFIAAYSSRVVGATPFSTTTLLPLQGGRWLNLIVTIQGGTMSIANSANVQVASVGIPSVLQTYPQVQILASDPWNSPANVLIRNVILTSRFISRSPTPQPTFLPTLRPTSLAPTPSPSAVPSTNPSPRPTASPTIQMLPFFALRRRQSVLTRGALLGVLQLPSSFTLAVDIFPLASSAQGSSVLNILHLTASNSYFGMAGSRLPMIGMLPGLLLQLDMYTGLAGLTSNVVAPTTTLPLQSWTTLRMTVAAGTITVWVGGAQVQTSIASNSLAPAFPRVQVFASSPWATPANCFIANVLIAQGNGSIPPTQRPTRTPTARRTQRRTPQPTVPGATNPPTVTRTRRPTNTPRPTVTGATNPPTTTRTRRPTPRPTLRGQTNAPRTRRPRASASPSLPRPSIAPVVQPTAEPSNLFGFCRQFSASATNGATVNTATCFIDACPFQTFTAGTCNGASPGPGVSGPILLRLLDRNGNQLAQNSGSCGNGASITFSTRGPCQTYQLAQGCVGGAACSGAVMITGARVGRLPTMFPTRRPTLLPTAEPSALPTLLPSQPPTRLPVARATPAPTTRPTQQISFCPVFSASATNSARSNFVPCYVHLCPNDIVTIGNCNAATGTCGFEGSGDQYIRLFDLAAPPTPQAGQPGQSGQAGQGGQLRRLQGGSSSPTGSPLPSASPSASFSSVEPTASGSALPSSEPSSSASGLPTAEPSASGSRVPTPEPSLSSASGLPSAEPTVEPSASGSGLPTVEPTVEPITSTAGLPTAEPSASGFVVPTVPTPEPFASAPSPRPRPRTPSSSRRSRRPSVEPTTPGPTTEPTDFPTPVPVATVLMPGRMNTPPRATQVAANDNFCGLCSQFTYQYVAPRGGACKLFLIQQGCAGSGSCTGQVQVTGARVGRVPTYAPSSQPTLGPTPTALFSTPEPSAGPMAPFVEPTVRQSQQPSTEPSRRPSALPTIATFFCGDYRANNTNGATANTAQCSFFGCPGQQVVISDCNAEGTSYRTQYSTGPLALQLIGPASDVVASAATNCGNGVSLAFSVPASASGAGAGSCPIYTINMGCAGSAACSGILRVVNAQQAGSFLTLAPTEQPTEQPSQGPTSPPTDFPTNQPTDVPSRRPSVEPSSFATPEPSAEPTAEPSGSLPTVTTTTPRPSRQPATLTNTLQPTFSGPQPTTAWLGGITFAPVRSRRPTPRGSSGAGGPVKSGPARPPTPSPSPSPTLLPSPSPTSTAAPSTPAPSASSNDGSGSGSSSSSGAASASALQSPSILAGIVVGVLLLLALSAGAMYYGRMRSARRWRGPLAKDANNTNIQLEDFSGDAQQDEDHDRRSAVVDFANAYGQDPRASSTAAAARTRSIVIGPAGPLAAASMQGGRRPTFGSPSPTQPQRHQSQLHAPQPAPASSQEQRGLRPATASLRFTAPMARPIPPPVPPRLKPGLLDHEQQL